MLMVIIGESSERAAIASDLYVRTAECRKDTKGHLQSFGVSMLHFTPSCEKNGRSLRFPKIFINKKNW